MFRRLLLLLSRCGSPCITVPIFGGIVPTHPENRDHVHIDNGRDSNKTDLKSIALPSISSLGFDIV